MTQAPLFCPPADSAFEIEIIGDRRKATVIPELLFDPDGRRTRM